MPFHLSSSPWELKRLAPPNRQQRSSSFPRPHVPRPPLQPPDAPTRRWAKRPISRQWFGIARALGRATLYECHRLQLRKLAIHVHEPVLCLMDRLMTLICLLISRITHHIPPPLSTYGRAENYATTIRTATMANLDKGCAYSGVGRSMADAR